MKREIHDKLTYAESPAYAVAAMLRSMGYEIASSSGQVQKEPDHHVVRILEPREPVKQGIRGLFGVGTNQKPLYLGELWLDNGTGEAVFDSRWVLEVCGRDNIPKLTEIANILTNRYEGITIDIKLVSEGTRFGAESMPYRRPKRNI